LKNTVGSQEKDAGSRFGKKKGSPKNRQSEKNLFPSAKLARKAENFQIQRKDHSSKRKVPGRTGNVPGQEKNSPCLKREKKVFEPDHHSKKGTKEKKEASTV